MTIFVMFYYAPDIGRIVSNYMKPCVCSDLDENGKPYGLFKLVDTTDTEKCPFWFVPLGKRAPSTFFMILYSGITGWQSVAQINFVYWLIYRSEIPFIEQYKIEVDKPWPWK